MKKLQVLAAAAVLGAMSMGVQADSYWSAQYSQVTIDTPFFDVSPAAIELAYGMGINDWASAEGYVGFGMGDDDGAEVDLTYGLAGIASYEVSEGFNISAQLAYNYVEFNFGDDAELGAGVGASYAAGPGAVTVEYRQLIEDVTAISIGYQMAL